MGERVTRESLLKFFVDSCCLLEDYDKIGRILDEELVKGNARLEEVVKDYREYQNVECLIPILIRLSRYYACQKANNLAVMYLIECQCILENLEKNHILKGYIYAELGYIYETKGMFKEAEFYYELAASFGKDHNLLILMSYSLERLIRVLMTLVQYKKLERIDKLDKKYSLQNVPIYLRKQLRWLKLYATQDFEEIVKIYGEEYRSEDGFMQEVIGAYALAQLNRVEEIEWDLQLLDISVSLPLNVYRLMYHLTYHLVHDKDEELERYMNNMMRKLKDKNQHGWLAFVCHLFVQSARIQKNEWMMSKLTVGLSEVNQQIHYEEQRFRPRIQGLYNSYRNYYKGIQLMPNKGKFRVVSWNRLPMLYQYDYTPKTLLGYFKFDACFYNDFKPSLLKSVIDVIQEEFVGEGITFSVEKEGLWFYFEVSCGEVKLKRKINRFVEYCYEKLGQPYFVTFCIPRLTTASFEETSNQVKRHFCQMVLNSNPKLPYQMNYCQGKPIAYNLLDQVHQAIEMADYRGEINIEYAPLYHRESNELFGIECSTVLDENRILSQLPIEDATIGRELLNIEREMYLFEVGCDYLKRHEEEHGVKLSLFIKFSRQALLHKWMPSRVISYLKEHKIDPNQVIISVNEDILFEQNDLIQKAVKRLREYDVNIALDEYGAGALTGSIRNLSIDYLRISSCFIQYLKSSKNYLSMMNSLINVCMSKDVKLCCSEIENESSLHLMSDFGIDVVSGSYYQGKLVV